MLVPSTVGATFVYFFASFKRPIFILSAPRAGSSFLFELLHRSFLLWGAVRENDHAWWTFFPYVWTEPTDHIEFGAFQSRVSRRELRLRLVKEMLLQRREELPSYLFQRVFRHDSCFLDKTIANAFHLEVLHRVFPDARFVYLIRDGRANVSSMIEGWQSGTFWKRPAAMPAGATIEYWTFPFPPGWQQQTRRPLEEICAWSWIEHNRWILDEIDRLGLSDRVHVVRYEDLVDQCDATLKGIERSLGLLRIGASDSKSLAEIESWSTVSKPARDKWKSVHVEKINRIETQLVPMMSRLGYVTQGSHEK